MKNEYLFGPVPSRRLGMSLGVDLVPYKTCTLDCVYCECGETTALTLERKEFVPTDQVLSELDAYLSTKPELDYITFSGAGEPTLHSRIGDVVAFVKDNYPMYKTCLLTNATLLGNTGVVEAIKDVDLVIPSLDAVKHDDFIKVNRPSEKLDVAQFIEDIVVFCNDTKSVVWLEIFIVPGCNDSEESVCSFKDVVARIKPDKIQLNTLDRPGAVDWIEAPSQASVDMFVDALEGIAPIEVVGKFNYSTNSVYDNITIDELICRVSEMISRRPCTAKDVAFSLSLPAEKVSLALDEMVLRGGVVCEELDRGLFFKLKSY